MPPPRPTRLQERACSPRRPPPDPQTPQYSPAIQTLSPSTRESSFPSPFSPLRARLPCGALQVSLPSSCPQTSGALSLQPLIRQLSPRRGPQSRASFIARFGASPGRQVTPVSGASSHFLARTETFSLVNGSFATHSNFRPFKDQGRDRGSYTPPFRTSPPQARAPHGLHPQPAAPPRRFLALRPRSNFPVPGPSICESPERGFSVSRKSTSVGSPVRLHGTVPFSPDRGFRSRSFWEG